MPSVDDGRWVAKSSGNSCWLGGLDSHRSPSSIPGKLHYSLVLPTDGKIDVSFKVVLRRRHYFTMTWEYGFELENHYRV